MNLRWWYANPKDFNDPNVDRLTQHFAHNSNVLDVMEIKEKAKNVLT